MQSQESKKNDLKKARTIATIVVVALVAIAVTGVFLTLTIKKPAQRFTPGNYSPGYGEDAKIIQEQDQNNVDQKNAIGGLYSKLPYKGKDFSFDFDYSIGRFKATISNKNKIAGDSEFDEFLKSNGITGRDSFTNLDVEYK